MMLLHKRKGEGRLKSVGGLRTGVGPKMTKVMERREVSAISEQKCGGCQRMGGVGCSSPLQSSLELK